MPRQLFMRVRFQAKPACKEELYRRLIELVAYAQQELGCLFYHLHVDRDDDAIFYFSEGWANQAALDRHNSTVPVQAIIADTPRLTEVGVEVEFMHRIAPNGSTVEEPAGFEEMT
ncbi:MAG: putative quinol monooxygenase [Motiliproteus sp.]